MINIKNKKADGTSLILLIVFMLVIIVFSGVMLYLSDTVKAELKTVLPNTGLVGDGNNNVSEVIDNTMGATYNSFLALKWISIFLIFGMILSIFIGSYMVTTKPVFFVPYFIVMAVAIIIGVGVSNAYEQLLTNDTLGSTFQAFEGTNWMLRFLPMIISVVGFVGAIIMYSTMGGKEERTYV